MGSVFPALAGNKALADEKYVVDVILNGKPGTSMPAFGSRLSDDQIAALASYIRNSWGNDFGRVEAGDVAALR